MRKLKKALSLTLALALSLVLAAPAMAAGETTIQDNGGFSYTLSKPAVGTRVDDQYGITYYQITEGTIITPVLPEGTVKEEVEAGEYYMGGRLVYRLPNGGGAVRYYVGDVYDTPYGVDIASFGDLEGMLLFDETTPSQPLLVTPTRPSALGDGRYCIECHFFENADDFDYFASGASDLYLEVVPDSGSTAPEQPGGPVVEDIPSSGTAKASTQAVEVDGKKVEFQMYALLDDQGGGYNYFKLRDLGAALGFTVDWSAQRGVYIETAK